MCEAVHKCGARGHHEFVRGAGRSPKFVLAIAGAWARQGSMLSRLGLTTRNLKPLDLEVADGECVSVQGPSGSGKSLLLRAVADLALNEGQAFLDGRERGSKPAPEWRRQVVYLATDAGWWAPGVEEHFADWTAIEESVEGLGLDPECRHWPVSRLLTGESVVAAPGRSGLSLRVTKAKGSANVR